MSEKIAIFAHWDPDNLIDDYVVYYLTELQKIADIIFVSDCNLPQNELEKVEPLVLRSLARRHGEYDFGSYKRGFLSAERDLCDYDELIFVNDSCYGPFFPFEDLWKEMDARPCDYWGLFKHLDPTLNIWHIQSYFIVLKKHVFLSACFRAFMKDINPEGKKRDIILKYEVGLSDTLNQSGFHSAALCPESSMNETHQAKTYDLTRRYKLPLIKRSLLATNPFREPYLYKTVASLKRFLGNVYSYKLIENHLTRTAPKNYKNGWFCPRLIDTTLLHRKFIKIKEKPGKYFCYLRIKIFGIPLPLIPSRFLLGRWEFEKKRRQLARTKQTSKQSGEPTLKK